MAVKLMEIGARRYLILHLICAHHWHVCTPAVPHFPGRGLHSHLYSQPANSSAFNRNPAASSSLSSVSSITISMLSMVVSFRNRGVDE